MRKLFVFLLSPILLVSCDPNISSDTQNIQAYVPVYAQLSEMGSIDVQPVQSTAKAGKIYAYGNYIFQNDVNKGIHIIDNSIPAQPAKIAFLKIPYSSELAVKGSYLYANCVSDLLVFDLQNPRQPVLIKRVKDVFPLISQDYPPFTGIYFVCADPKKGIVVDWQLQSVKNPACRR